MSHLQDSESSCSWNYCYFRTRNLRELETFQKLKEALIGTCPQHRKICKKVLQSFLDGVPRALTVAPETKSAATKKLRSAKSDIARRDAYQLANAMGPFMVG